MARRTSWGTVFWALIFIALGGVLLARNLGYPVPIWRGLATYWPVLIILWGAVKAIDAVRARRSNEAGSVFSPGEVVLVILLLVFGTAFTTAVNVTGDWTFSDVVGEVDLFDFLGENHDFYSELAENADSGGTLEIQNGAGSVTVEPHDEGRIVVEIEKRVRAVSEERAAEFERELTFTIGNRAGRYVIASNYSGLSGDLQQRLRSGLTVRVPREFSVDVSNSLGPVVVSDLRGDQSIVNRYGGVTLSRIEGNVEVDNRSGSVVVENTVGALAVRTRYGSVDVRNHDGVADIDNQYAPVSVVDVTSDLEVSNRYSEIAVRQVGGDVTVEGGHNRVELSDIAGGADVETSYRSLVLADVEGAISVVNRHGDIELAFSEAPASSLTVSGDYSDVRVQLPSTSEFSLEAQVRSGTFESDFEGFDRESVRRDTSVSGSLGSAGPLFRINTARGNIRLLRR